MAIQPTFIHARTLIAYLRRIGCTPTERSTFGEQYWVTKNGYPFPVSDPSNVSQNGKLYPFEYANDIYREAYGLTYGIPNGAHGDTAMLAKKLRPH